MGTGLGELALGDDMSVGAASARRIGRSLRSRARILGLCAGAKFGAPRLRTYFVPVYRRSVILRTTNIVNRTVPVHGGRLAVNPGIPPAFIARVSGAPVPTYRVRPRVFASTHGVSGAVQINRDELRRPPPGGPPGRPGGPGRPGIAPPPRLPPVSIQRTTTMIQPSTGLLRRSLSAETSRGD